MRYTCPIASLALAGLLNLPAMVQGRSHGLDGAGAGLTNPLTEQRHLSIRCSRARITGDRLADDGSAGTFALENAFSLGLGKRHRLFVRPVLTLVTAPSEGIYAGASPAHPVLAGRGGVRHCREPATSRTIGGAS